MEAWAAPSWTGKACWAPKGMQPCVTSGSALTLASPWENVQRPHRHDILTRRKVLLIFIATALPLPCEVFGICDCLHLVSTEKHVVLNWWLIRKGLRLDTYFIYYYFNFIHFLYLFSRNREDVPEDATTTVLKRQGLLVAGTPCASWSNGATPGRMNIKGSISFHLPCLLLFLQVYL